MNQNQTNALPTTPLDATIGVYLRTLSGANKSAA